MQYYKKNGSLLLSNLISIPNATFLSYLLLAFGLTTSPAVISISTGILFCVAILNVVLNKFNINQKVSPTIYYLFPISIFLINCIYIFFDFKHLDEMLAEIRIKLPFLLLGVSGWLLPTLSLKQVRILFKVFVIVVTVIASASMINYFIYFDEMQLLMQKSKAIPIITLTKNYSHIYFGIMAAFAVLLSWHIYSSLHTNERWFWLTIATIIFMELHVISSRTGLITVYAGILFEIIRMVWVTRRWITGGVLLLTMLIIIFTAMYSVPAIKTKIENTQNDIRHFRNNVNLGDWSLARRILVWRMSLGIIYDHPLSGLGPVGSKKYLYQAYDHYGFEVHHDQRIDDPHNQYLQMGIDFGIVGILLLIGMLIIPWFIFGKHITPIHSHFLIICTIGMLFESLLERQYGISFFMIFYSLLTQATKKYQFNHI